MQDLPTQIPILFVAATLLTLAAMFAAISGTKHRSTLAVILGLIVWLAVTAALAFTGFYSDRLDLIPPRLLLFGVLPPLVLIILTLSLPSMRRWADGIPLSRLTNLHSVRILVEIGLLWLSWEKVVPEIMTFEGWNFDILAGISAPLVAYLAFNRKVMGKKGLLIWNILALCLLLTVVTIGILSAPFPLQALAFDQPNRALLFFPYVWLPVFIVPAVLFSHLVAIRQLASR